MGFKSKVDGRRGNVQQTEDYYGDKAEGRWDISPNLVLVCAITNTLLVISLMCQSIWELGLGKGGRETVGLVPAKQNDPC